MSNDLLAALHAADDLLERIEIADPGTYGDIAGVREQLQALGPSAAQTAEAASAAPQGAPIPGGVYYSLDADNFYDTDGTGMSHAFYREWQPRCMSFPTSRLAATLAASPRLAAAERVALALEEALPFIRPQDMAFPIGADLAKSVVAEADAALASYRKAAP